MLLDLYEKGCCTRLWRCKFNQVHLCLVSQSYCSLSYLHVKSTKIEASLSYLHCCWCIYRSSPPFSLFFVSLKQHTLLSFLYFSLTLTHCPYSPSCSLFSVSFTHNLSHNLTDTKLHSLCISHSHSHLHYSPSHTISLLLFISLASCWIHSITLSQSHPHYSHSLHAN